MGKKDDGGAAFPCIWEGTTRGDASGMTMRDYFAAAAMTGIISHPTNQGVASFFAKNAYAIADAMLAERAK